MNPPPLPPAHPPTGRAFIGRRTADASTLVIVLGMLALLLALMLSFFLSVTSEVSSSQGYASAITARRFAESAVEMIRSQIRLGSATGTAGTTVGAPFTWTSQPGLIRMFDSTGAPADVLKLYSASKMHVAATDYQETDDDPPTDWTASPAVYIDLNRPAYDADGYLNYPIVDPRAATDNAATGAKAVAGFTLGTTVPGYDPTQPASPTNNPAPMPVRWLYILQDGEIATPDSADASTGDVTFTPTGPQPTASNPIVGRTAIWTDDETCKLNVNTAGYGYNTNLNDSNPYWTYWDTPMRLTHDEDQFLSRDQPWKGEYQRYPGHPATTGLRLALPELARADLFTLTPRLVDGGSVGGTMDSSRSGTGFVAKQDRLYASVDELFYNPARTPIQLGTSVPADSRHNLEAKRFFLTANSRAPEVNLFGQPRVTIWPIPSATASRSALDSLIAFCATSGTESYYFTRSNPMSASADLALSGNLNLYAYLQRMTGEQGCFPGFPGTAGGFLKKYGTDRDQILTSIFDTIRSTNLAEMTSGVTPYTSNSVPSQIMGQVVPTENPNGTRGAGRINVITEADLVFVNMDSTTKGTPAAAKGTTPATKSKIVMGILFKFNQPVGGAVGGGIDFNYTVTGLSSLSVTGDTIVAPFGSDTYQHGMREYSFGAAYGGSNLRVNCLSDTYMGVTSGSNVTFDLPPTSNLFDVTGPTFLFNGGTITVKIRTPYDAPTGPADPYTQSYTFTFPPITNNLPTPPYLPDAAPSPYRDVTGTGPWNNLLAANQPNSAYNPSTKTFAVDGRFTGYNVNWIGQSDTVRSLQLKTGDTRSIAFTKDVPASMFQKTGGSLNLYDNTSYAQVCGIDMLGTPLGLAGQAGHKAGTTYGTLMSGLGDPVSTATVTGAYKNLVPWVPVGINGVTNSLGAEGDWDNGFAWLPSGSYLPKPDEGVIYIPPPTGAAQNWGYFVRSNGIEKLMYLGDQPTVFSANRQVPSAVVFGSTPTGVLRGLPWQTLLFRPARSYHMGGTNHPGAASPPDHLLLDLFEMPVVEPYAISEPFSTAGKVNMNYRMKPFDAYVTRNTAVRAVLESTQIAAIPRDVVQNYRPDLTNVPPPQDPSLSTDQTRFPINSAETLKLFEARFNATSGNRVFVSPSEICTLDLVPSTMDPNTGQAVTSDPISLNSFWNAPLTDLTTKRFTGDNSLERPYGLIYPRLTTRSNTFAVHVFSQAVTMPVGQQTKWNERTGQVLGQWRGEYGIERYVPTGATRPNFLQGDANLDNTYKFRTLYVKRFSP